MSHGDCVTVAPDGFTVTAQQRPGARWPRSRTSARRRAGVQFHPEVVHTPHGQRVLERFLHDIAGIEPTWTSAGIIDEQVARDPGAGRRRAR